VAAEAEAGAKVIHVVNTLRANLIRKEIEGKIHEVLSPRFNPRDWSQGPGTEHNLFRVNRIVRNLERLRMRRWAPWKDRR
jgi:hypothetical protein